MTITPNIHWIGAGLASGPGIVSLANKWGAITVWDMVHDRAEALKTHIKKGSHFHIRSLNLDDDHSCAIFLATLKPHDIIVSMLPAPFHVRVAKIALSAKCHMVTSSYLSNEMIALNAEAIEKDISLVNEVGLDPGIDHLLAHMLVDAARKAGMLGQGHDIDFISYCGGLPAVETAFTYKFSWTPLGVLTALSNPAQMIKDGAAHTVEKAWDNITELSLSEENFEGYANRNSLPYITEYGLSGETSLRRFVRGTLRLKGWKKAWKDIFAAVEQASPKDLKKLSDDLWLKHQYEAGEEDRVVLHVALMITPKKGKEWKASLSLDMIGSGWQSAMASAVSLTVSEAVSALMMGRLPSGVQAAPHDISEARLWVKGLKESGLNFTSVNVHMDA